MNCYRFCAHLFFNFSTCLANNAFSNISQTTLSSASIRLFRPIFLTNLRYIKRHTIQKDCGAPCEHTFNYAYIYILINYGYSSRSFNFVLYIYMLTDTTFICHIYIHHTLFWSILFSRSFYTMSCENKHAHKYVLILGYVLHKACFVKNSKSCYKVSHLDGTFQLVLTFFHRKPFYLKCRQMYFVIEQQSTALQSANTCRA